MRRSKKVKTPDDWYPTDEDGCVAVYVHRMKGKGGNKWRVCVWGDDDFGLEKDGLTVVEAFKLFRNIQDGVTKKQLKDIGFIGA